MTVLTDAAIRAAKPFTTIWDTNLRGFGVSTGKARKSFIVLVASGRRHTIGNYPLMTLSDARTQARRVLAEKTLGKVRPKHVAFDDARDDFLRDREPHVRPLTHRLYKRHLTVHYPFGRRGVGDITTRQIAKQLAPLNDRPAEKEHAHRIGRMFFKWCEQQDLIDRSPMAKMVKPPVGQARDRVLSDAELRKVFRAAWKGESPFHQYVCLLLLLGLRRMEAARLQWDFFDEETHTLTIPGELTKNKRALVIPYGSAVATLLNRIPRFSETYLFPAAREQVKGKPVTVMTGFGTRKRDFDKECGVHGWVLHDCRRVVAVGLQRLGTRLEVIEALLNHVSGSRSGIVGIYQRYDFQPELRIAVQAWEQYLQSLLFEGKIMADENFATYMQRERDRLHGEREGIFTQQQELETKLDAINREFQAIEAYEAAKSGKAARGTGTGNPRAMRSRRGSKREGILQAIKNAAGGLSRGELLQTLGLKGDKSGEMSVSNALTALTKGNQVRRDGGKYHAA